MNDRPNMLHVRPAHAGMLIVALLVALALCGCAAQGTGNPSSGAASSSSAVKTPDTPAYYVFESTTIDDVVITDPNHLVTNTQGSIEDWYYLSVALFDAENGRLCTDGRLVEFTYDFEDGAITVHAATNMGIDFGYDGTVLEVGDGTLTLTERKNVTVLRQVAEPPVPFREYE